MLCRIISLLLNGFSYSDKKRRGMVEGGCGGRKREGRGAAANIPFQFLKVCAMRVKVCALCVKKGGMGAKKDERVHVQFHALLLRTARARLRVLRELLARAKPQGRSVRGCRMGARGSEREGEIGFRCVVILFRPSLLPARPRNHL